MVIDEIEWMIITKCRDFAKQMSQKLSSTFQQKSFWTYRFVKLGDTEAILESKLVKSVRPRHFGESEIARVSQRIELGHTDL